MSDCHQYCSTNHRRSIIVDPSIASDHELSDCIRAQLFGFASKLQLPGCTYLQPLRRQPAPIAAALSQCYLTAAVPGTYRTIAAHPIAAATSFREYSSYAWQILPGLHPGSLSLSLNFYTVRARYALALHLFRQHPSNRRIRKRDGSKGMIALDYLKCFQNPIA